MPPGRDASIVAATLDHVRDRLAIDVEFGGKIPAEVRHSDHNETASRFSGVSLPGLQRKSENQKKSSDVAGRGPHRIIVAQSLSPPHALNAPERAMRAKLGDFAGGLFTDVNSDGNDTDKRAHENHRHEPRRDVPDAQRVIKRYEIIDWRTGVQKDFRQPRDQDQDENEHVIPFHPAPDCFQFRDLKAGQNQIFAYELFPFALKQFAIFHDHRDKKMRFKHADARAEGVVKAVSSRFDPEQHSNDSQVKKENDVRHFARGKSDRNNGSAAGDGPVGRHIQPLPPYHAPPQLAAIKMRHRVDIARIVKAPLQGNCPFLFRRYRCILSCHSLLVNWITAFAA